MFGWFKGRKKTPDFDRSQLVPRIKNTSFRDALGSMGMPLDQLPITEPLVADLLVTYAFDLPATFVMASPAHLQEVGLTAGELRGVAVNNLGAQIPGIQLGKMGEVYRVVIGNNLDACVLLATSFWKEAAQEVSGRLVAVVPNRDAVFFCDWSNTQSMAQMKQMSDQEFANGGNHALSKTLIRWSDNGWTA